jgi:hypothetical protein
MIAIAFLMIPRSPFAVLTPVTGGRSSHSVSISSSLSTGSLATDNILKGAKPADLPVRQVMLIALTELID